MSSSSFEQAVAAQREGDSHRARNLYLAHLEQQPQDTAACNNLGLLDAAEGRLQQAREWFEQAIEHDPQSLDGVTNLMQACVALDDALAAAGQLTAALSHVPQPASLREALLERAERVAVSAFEQGKTEAAWRLARTVVLTQPERSIATGVLAHSIRHMDPRSAQIELREDLLHCLNADGVDYRELAFAAARSLELDYRWIRQAPDEDLLARLDSTGLIRDPLLLALLSQSLNAEPTLEKLLRAIRSAFLHSWQQGDAVDDEQFPLLGALAAQCFGNEYVWWLDDDERDMLSALDAHVSQQLSDDEITDTRALLRAVAILACYQPLFPHPNEQVLFRTLSDIDEPWASTLRRRMLEEPASESRIAAEIEGDAPTDSTSQAVRAQYEDAPYPRWLSQEPQVPDTVSGLLAHLFPGLEPPAYLARPIDILIAGCGTGEHAIRVARRHPQCAVTGIDLSRRSLAYAARKAQEMNVTNLRLRQRDILALPEDAARYHVIESVGVIHHMSDPTQGLAALTQVMRPGGVIKLGLYARAARGAVRSARERINALGLSSNAHDIRALRRRILNGEEQDLSSLARSLDFYSLSSVRDLLFHVREHQFDIAGVHALIRDAGLVLIGFQVPTSVRDRYVARYAGDRWMTNLESLRRFEREYPGAFSGMYQFWCFNPPG